MGEKKVPTNRSQTWLSLAVGEQPSSGTRLVGDIGCVMAFESGFEVKASKPAAVHDRARHPHEPPFPFHIYKLFFSVRGCRRRRQDQLRNPGGGFLPGRRPAAAFPLAGLARADSTNVRARKGFFPANRI